MLPASSPLPPDLAAAFNRTLARAPAMRLDLRWFASVGSTMDLVAVAAQAGAPEGLVICADEQTAGRGRRGRTWSSPPGAGLYFSLLLRPPPDATGGPRALGLLTLAAGVAVHEAIARATGLATQLKWPNDVMCNRRKLAGILAEGQALHTIGQSVVVGVGVNLSRGPHPFDVADRATSIGEELGQDADRSALVEELLVALADRYDRLRRGEADDILRSWRAAAAGAHGARVECPDGRVGFTTGIDDTGALLVQTASGVARVIAGEVRWL